MIETGFIQIVLQIVPVLTPILFLTAAVWRGWTSISRRELIQKLSALEKETEKEQLLLMNALAIEEEKRPVKPLPVVKNSKNPLHIWMDED